MGVGGMEGWVMGREENKLHFGVAVATWGSHKVPTMSGDIHGAMAAISGNGSQIGTLQRCHSLNCEITGLANCPPEKQTS